MGDEGVCGLYLEFLVWFVRGRSVEILRAKTALRMTAGCRGGVDLWLGLSDSDDASIARRGGSAECADSVFQMFQNRALTVARRDPYN